MKGYEEYVNSEIDWIGSLPKNWVIRKFGHVSYMKGRIGWQGLKQSEFSGDSELPFLITGMNFKDGKIRWKEVYHISEERFEEAPEIHLKENDILFTKDGTIGKLLYVDKIPRPGKASLNSHLLVLRPIDDYYVPQFMYYQLQGSHFKFHVELVKTGTTFFGISQEAMSQCKLIFPPKEEQTLIARFLDQKTSQIDRLIEQKEKLLTLLSEKRTAIITQAVTKGLDPNVEMKESGIGWLARLPKHWQTKRLRFLIQTNPVKSEISLMRDDLVSFVPMESVHEYGGISLDQDKEVGDVYDGYTYFREGDVVVAKITPCFENGKGSLAEKLTNQIAFGTTELHVMRPKKGMNKRFLFYLSISDHFRKIGEAWMYGAGGQKRVPEVFIKNFFVQFCDYDEQQIIVNWLDRKVEEIKSTSLSIEKSIDKLKEYREALITAAVTGQIDVREEVLDE